MKNELPNALNALALHLDAVSRINSGHRGAGWTYDDEVRTLKIAAEEITALRTALADLVDAINAHEIESLQCDGRDDDHCNCLRKSARKASLLLPIATINCL